VKLPRRLRAESRSPWVNAGLALTGGAAVWLTLYLLGVWISGPGDERFYTQPDVWIPVAIAWIIVGLLWTIVAAVAARRRSNR
jgi:hypothetical protein